MTLEQILLAGLSAVTSALIFVCRLLWARSQKCEAALDKLREDYDKLAAEHGVATGTLAVYRRCKVPICPYADMTPAPRALPA